MMAPITNVFKRNPESKHHRTGHPQSRDALGTGRIEAFSDGVFAVAITLLVLNLQIPQETLARLQEGQLEIDLLKEGSKFASYALSFVIVGIYWVGHHNTFHYIKHSDRILLWINNLLLLFIVFIPFPTALLGQYWNRQVPIIVYAATLIATGLVLQMLWWYATYDCRLVDKDIDPGLMRRATRRNLTGPFLYFVAIVASFLSPYLSVFFLLLVPLIYIVPGGIDRHWKHRHHQEASEEKEAELPTEQ